MKLALFISIVATFLFLTVASSAVPEEWETKDVLPNLQNANTAQQLDDTLMSASDNSTKNKTRPKLVSDLSKIKPPNITRNDTTNKEDITSNSGHPSAGESTGPSSERKNPIHSDHEQAELLNGVESHTNEHTKFRELKIDDKEASHKEVFEEKNKKEPKVSTSDIATHYRNVWTGIHPYYYTSQVHIGYAYGWFYTVNLNGAHYYSRFISSMKVFYGNYYIYGILFEYTDGMRTWSYAMGSCHGYYTDTFYLQLGEKLTTLNIYGSNHGYFGGFYLRTDQGRSFAAYPLRAERHGPFRVPIGSGVLASAVGYYYPSLLYSLGFQMLNRVTRIEINHLYHGLHSVSLHPMQFHTITYDNTNGHADQHYILKDCKTMRRSYEWRSYYGRALEAHFSDIMEFYTNIPVLHPSSTTTGSLQYGILAKQPRNESKTEERCYEFPVAVQAGRSTTMSAVLYSGSYQTYYSGYYYLYYDSDRSYCQYHWGYLYGVTPSKIVAQILNQ